MTPTPVAPAPIIVAATFGAEDFAMLDALRRAHFPPERNRLPAHLTLFHHLPPSVAPELDRRLAQLATEPPPPARLERVMLLGGGVALAIGSPALEAMRAELAEAFKGLLVPQDAARWRPHVTVQNKVGLKAAEALHDELVATFAPRPVAIAGLASHLYRGGDWEPIAAHAFRGVSRSGRHPRS
ncbi:MAG: 2'-5' RNA ligase family protein [Sphingomonadaceae bacterium]|nr:2'-5' RNA ligase family protein [Sphingomonadaceae bacterium]